MTKVALRLTPMRQCTKTPPQSRGSTTVSGVDVDVGVGVAANVLATLPTETTGNVAVRPGIGEGEPEVDRLALPSLLRPHVPLLALLPLLVPIDGVRGVSRLPSFSDGCPPTESGGEDGEFGTAQTLSASSAHVHSMRSCSMSLASSLSF